MSVVIRTLKEADYEAVSRIYAEGIATGIATFETEVLDWPDWNDKYISSCRLVAIIADKVVGFAVLSKVSNREVYKGVAEVSVYVSNHHKGKGIGEDLLNQLIIESENKSFWTLQASIFSENRASINLHIKCGFKVVGIREKIGKLHGKWHDNMLLEKRTNKSIL
ncbi:MAG: N-acetyltransferase family protein [Flavobacteriaceae bacterium]|nr:MAG: N-acetyltransferase family protein [Flavobacteriaceae bacterium]